MTHSEEYKGFLETLSEAERLISEQLSFIKGISEALDKLTDEDEIDLAVAKISRFVNQTQEKFNNV